MFSNRRFLYSQSLNLILALYFKRPANYLAALEALCFERYLQVDAINSIQLMITWPGSRQRLQPGSVKAGKVGEELGIHKAFAR